MKKVFFSNFLDRTTGGSKGYQKSGKNDQKISEFPVESGIVGKVLGSRQKVKRVQKRIGATPEEPGGKKENGEIAILNLKWRLFKIKKKWL